MFEILSLFFVLETFLYQFDFVESELKITELQALKIVFWILIFIITLLLYVRTDIEYTPQDDDIKISPFSGAIFSKYIIRLLIFTLFTVCGTVFLRQIKISFSNPEFIYFWYMVGALIILEVGRLVVRLTSWMENNRK